MTDLECFPYSVGHTDDGVCLLVRMGNYRILLDCGIEDISPLLHELNQPLPADWVFCSHAHADHARGLLALHQAFPNLPIYGSEVTNQLLPLNWLDEDEAPVPVFSQSIPWKSEVELAPELTVTLFPAGHLPGAAAILLRYTTPDREYKLFYTGDFFLSNSRLVEGFPLGELRGLKPDVLIIEGTYGTARYPNRRQLENQLAERLYQAIAEGRSILLPTPALGLGQELLMLLRSHHYFTGRDLDIWVDGAVATGCDIYLGLLSHFPSSVQNFAQHQPLFWDDRIRPRVRRFQFDYLAQIPASPCILITEDNIDMLDYALIPGRSWVVFLQERPGTRWQIPPALEAQFAGVETYFLPEHCDGAGTTQLIHNLRPQHIIWVHGSPTYLADLTNLDELRNRYQLHCPSAGTQVELPVGETFLQSAIAESHYEGELTELVSHVQIALPHALTSDPRWLSFADTGLVEARWQGEELVLRGISQREFLLQSSDRTIPPEVECCGNCHYYRGQRCWNPISALYSFKVPLDGYCPVFEPRQPDPYEEKGSGG